MLFSRAQIEPKIKIKIEINSRNKIIISKVLVFELGSKSEGPIGLCCLKLAAVSAAYN